MNRIETIMLGAGVLVLALLPQLLGFGFNNGDPILGFYPVHSWFAHQINAGGNFLWSSDVLGGFPVYLDLVGGLRSPVMIFVFSRLPFLQAYNVMILLGTALTFIFSYLAARRFRISAAGALLVAACFSFGDHIGIWSNNITVVSALFMLPLLILTLRSAIEGSYEWIPFALLGGGYAFHAGQPQWIIMSFLGAGLYLLGELWLGRAEREIFRRVAMVAAFLLLTATCSYLIGMYQINPAQRLAELSSRSAGISFTEAQVSAQTPFDWAWFVFPRWQFRFLNAQEPSLSIGVIGFILAIFGAISFRSDKRSAIGLYLFAFGLVTALRYSPVFWFIHQLPVFDLFRGSNRWMYIGNFGLSLLAGLGLDRLSVYPHIQYWKVVNNVLGKIIVVAVPISVSFSVVVWKMRDKMLDALRNWFDTYYYPHTVGGLRLEQYHDTLSSLFDATVANISVADVRFILSLAFLTAAYYVSRTIARRSVIGERGRLVIVAIAILNLIAFHPNYWEAIAAGRLSTTPSFADAIASKGDRYITLFPRSATDQELRQPHGEVVGVADEIEFRRAIMEPNIGAAYGASTIDGYSNLMTRRQGITANYLGSERGTAGIRLADQPIPLSEKLSTLTSRLNLFSMLNVRWLVSAYELPETSGLSLTASASVTRFNVPIYLYENTSVLPRVYLAHSVTFTTETDEGKLFELITQPGIDFAKQTFIECSNCNVLPSMPKRTDQVDVREYKDGYLRVKATTDIGRWLVFSESNLPGWRITLDGTPTPSYMTNFLFHGVHVPAGEHDIVFEYVGIGLM
jgi:hypothetical protein